MGGGGRVLQLLVAISVKRCFRSRYHPTRSPFITFSSQCKIFRFFFFFPTPITFQIHFYYFFLWNIIHNTKIFVYTYIYFLFTLTEYNDISLKSRGKKIMNRYLNLLQFINIYNNKFDICTHLWNLNPSLNNIFFIILLYMLWLELTVHVVGGQGFTSQPMSSFQIRENNPLILKCFI